MLGMTESSSNQTQIHKFKSKLKAKQGQTIMVETYGN